MAEKMKRSGNSRSRRMTYVKRKESVLKQAAELSMLYHIDVGLMMFSPTGQFTSFAHKGRVEDIFLRYLDHNDEHKECALERKLADLNWKKYEAEDKMRSYNPDMTKILTISEADLHQQFVMDAILRIEKLKMSIFPL
ncbi:hypothetical protein Gorai_002491, partial [Gossypium raimondii]|nr:hypothetical protein [Gossypium raimondii]